MMNGIAAPALLGLAAGARTSLGIAGIAVGIRRPGDPVPMALLRTRWGRLAAAGLVVGELVGDKLPQSPSRLQPTALGGRVLCAALGGAALPAPRGLDRRQDVGGRSGRVVAATVAATAAVAGALGGYRWRMLVADRGWPDLPAALTEDALALGATWYAARRG